MWAEKDEIQVWGINHSHSWVKKKKRGGGGEETSVCSESRPHPALNCRLEGNEDAIRGRIMGNTGLQSDG